MLLRYLSAAALALQSANAFKDASPFLLYSTSHLDIESPNTNVLSAQRLKNAIETQLKACPSDTYVVVSQPGVSANDLSVSESTPHLRRRLSANDKKIKSVSTVKNLVGQVNAMELVAIISRACVKGEPRNWKTLLLHGEKGEIPTSPHDAIIVNFPELPSTHDDRESALLQADSYLNSLLATLDSYTLLYTTTPVSDRASEQLPEQYEMDEPYPEHMHIDLKRDLNSHMTRADNTTNPQANLPLFEKYQFLSPGIFMGGVVGLLLFSILYVGISAIANLEVSYMAFSKEMGPAAQKKQQQ